MPSSMAPTPSCSQAKRRAASIPAEAVEMMARIVAEAEAISCTAVAGAPPGAAPVDRRDHLRVDGARRAGPEYPRHRGLHRNRDNRTDALEVSVRRPTFMALPNTGSVQPYEPAVGMTPLHCPSKLTVADMADFAEQELLRRQVLSPGDVFGLIAGTTSTAGATNFMRLITAGRAQRPKPKKNLRANAKRRKRWLKKSCPWRSWKRCPAKKMICWPHCASCIP